MPEKLLMCSVGPPVLEEALWRVLGVGEPNPFNATGPGKAYTGTV